MAIASYSDVLRELKAWSGRTDLTDAEYSSFIYLAGSMANQFLRVPAMEATALIDVEDGDRAIVPFDFLELKSMTAPWNSDQGVPLERVSWEQFVRYSNGGVDQNGPPKYFCRQGTYFFVTPKLPPGSKLTCHYYRSIPDINATEQLNWLVMMSPLTYLFGGLHFLYLFVFDETRAEYWRQKMEGELSRVQEMAASSEHRGSHLVVRDRYVDGG